MACIYTGMNQGGSLTDPSPHYTWVAKVATSASRFGDTDLMDWMAGSEPSGYYDWTLSYQYNAGPDVFHFTDETTAFAFKMRFG